MALTIIENFQDANMVTEVSLTRETVNKICRDVIEAMKNGLKEEARSIEVFEYILQESLYDCRRDVGYQGQQENPADIASAGFLLFLGGIRFVFWREAPLVIPVKSLFP